MKIRCPHCQSPIELVDDSTDWSVISCPSCGSDFSLANFETTVASQPGKSRRIAQFELVEQIGQGAFGSVWKAIDLQLDRTVAVKIPRQGQLDPDEVEQFFREARAAAQLSHPNIVSIHEVGRHDETIYIVSDFISGLSLSDWISGQQPMPREAAQLCLTVAKALQHAHERGVIHRDLKPGNVMLDEDQRPHLMDFGLAKREAGEITMTVEGRVLGTPAYMSPEQARGEAHKADRRADIYSLGVILFQLLTGELPFRGTPRMLLHQVLHEEPRSPRALSDRVPRDLGTICLKAMAKEPARRYPTAQELGNDLSRWLNGRPILARPVGRVERSWRWCKRNPFLAFTTAVLLAVFAVGTLVSSWQWMLAQNNLQLAREERDRAEALEDARQMQLSRLYERESVLRMREGDLPYALLWATEALQILPKSHEQVHLHRVRIASFLRRTHKPSRIWATDSGEPLACAAFSRDMKQLATITRDRKLCVWNPVTGRPLAPPEVVEIEAASIRFSEDGTRLVLSEKSEPARVLVWSIATGKPEALVLEHYYPVHHAEFSFDGSLIATASGPNGSVGFARIWNASTGKLISTPIKHEYTVWQARFSPDATRFATASDEGAVGYSRIWNTTTGEALSSKLTHPSTVHRITYSPDGSLLATACLDGIVKVWDGATGDNIVDNLQLPYAIEDLQFSPDGKQIVTACSGREGAGEVQIWRAETGDPITPAMIHSTGVEHVLFTSDGEKIATVNEDATLQCWSATTGQSITAPMPHESRICAASISEDDEKLYSITENGIVRVWPTTQLDAPQWIADSEQLAQVSISPGNDLVAGATGYGYRLAHIWDAETGKPICPPLDHGGEHRVWDVAFSPDGRRLATAADHHQDIGRGFARIWDANTGDPLTPKLEHNSDYVYSCEFSPDGRLLLTQASQEVRVWRTKDGEPTEPKIDSQIWPRVTFASFSTDGQFLLTAYDGRLVSLWSLKDGVRNGVEIEAVSDIRRIELSRDAKRAAIVTKKGEVQVWEFKTGSLLFNHREYGAGIRRAQFSPDGLYLLIMKGWRYDMWRGSKKVKFEARLWEIASGQPAAPPIGDGTTLHSAQFSRDGRFILTAAESGNAQLWAADSSLEVGSPLQHQSSVEFATFNREEELIVTGSWNGEVGVWTIVPDTRPIEQLVALSRLISSRRIDDTGAMVSLSRKEFLRTWNLVTAKTGSQ